MSERELPPISQSETEVSATDLVRKVRDIVCAAKELDMHARLAVGNALYDAAIKLVNQDN